jgi:hypothetical protein
VPAERPVGGVDDIDRAFEIIHARHDAGAVDFRPRQCAVAPDQLRAAELGIEHLQPERAAPQRADPLVDARAIAGEQIREGQRADIVERPSFLVQAGIAQRLRGKPARQPPVDDVAVWVGRAGHDSPSLQLIFIIVGQFAWIAKPGRQ